jgi:hypothetical protein
LSDLNGAETYLSVSELKIVSKIFECEPLVMKLFRNSDQAYSTLKPILESALKKIQQTLEHYQSQDLKEQEGEETAIDFQFWNDLFASLTNVRPIISSF